MYQGFSYDCMIAYIVINCSISQPKHMLWILKRIVAMRRFFLAPNCRLILVSNKIFTILCSKLCLSIQYVGMIHLSEQVKLVERETLYNY